MACSAGRSACVSYSAIATQLRWDIWPWTRGIEKVVLVKAVEELRAVRILVEGERLGRRAFQALAPDEAREKEKHECASGRANGCAHDAPGAHTRVMRHHALCVRAARRLRHVSQRLLRQVGGREACERPDANVRVDR